MNEWVELVWFFSGVLSAVVLFVVVATINLMAGNKPKIVTSDLKSSMLYEGKGGAIHLSDGEIDPRGIFGYATHAANPGELVEISHGRGRCTGMRFKADMNPIYVMQNRDGEK